ncbi:Lysosomal Pro-X [Nesidiocoris tenuis]|uniref:Lysosomal Pro-X n=1 Tax=Nesidiocoris tenuis TaxID=355587 RepID=A0ABN7BDS0_9HEMI|nr:Lysosomal Pro-X [Nesidiocoris tenuis]
MGRFVIFLAFAVGNVAANGCTFKLKTFDVKVDHFSFTSTVTFPLRYLINDTFWNPSSRVAPIFIYTGNEGDVHWFAENTGLLCEFAPYFEAIIVFAEHRYYGWSMPFGNLSYSEPKYLRYLTSSQALADYVDLIEELKIAYPKQQKQHPTPVIAFGGSYGGMLSAWIRMKYPGVVTGALAASAPIWMFTNMTSCDAFNRVATSSYRITGGNECVDIIRKSWAAINRIGASDEGREWLTKTFKPCNPMNELSDIKLLKDWLVNMWVNLIMADYPYPANFSSPLPPYPVKVICKKIVDSVNDSSDDKQLLAGISEGATIFFNGTGNLKFMEFGTQCPPDSEVLGWGYQLCTEMVMPICDTGDTMFEKGDWDIESISDNCYKKYKVRPEVNYIRNMYGGKAISASSNIIFSNDPMDPWSTGGVLHNVSESSIAVLIPGGAHHMDLRPSDPLEPPSVKQARKLYRSVFKQWVNSLNDKF